MAAKKPALPDGSRLSALTQRARESQQLRPGAADADVATSTESRDESSTSTGSATRRAPRRTTQPTTQPTTRSATSSETSSNTGSGTGAGPTASALARQAAGLPATGRGTGLTAAERQARRRREKAQLVVELSPDQKAELLRSAAENERTLRAEVLARLFGS